MKIAPQRGAIPITLDRPRTLFFAMSGTWLLVQKYGRNFLPELYTLAPNPDNPKRPELALKDLEALRYFLWAGLQEEIVGTDEQLTEAEVGEFIRPWTMTSIFNAVVMAVTGANATPIPPGKDPASGATTASPAAKNPRRRKK